MSSTGIRPVVCTVTFLPRTSGASVVEDHELARRLQHDLEIGVVELNTTRRPGAGAPGCGAAVRAPSGSAPAHANGRRAVGDGGAGAGGAGGLPAGGRCGGRRGAAVRLLAAEDWRCWSLRRRRSRRVFRAGCAAAPLGGVDGGSVVALTRKSEDGGVFVRPPCCTRSGTASAAPEPAPSALQRSWPGHGYCCGGWGWAAVRQADGARHAVSRVAVPGGVGSRLRCSA